MTRFAMVAMIGFVLFLAFSSLFYTFSKCGWSTFFLGKGATFAAVTGMCDE